ncbi:MAG: bifunctional adenosylcobinamide kinase/adenosylcobinamide-phosphate guanylyltransferase [Leptothrix sp. (in: b-proteobacteria)]
MSILHRHELILGGQKSGKSRCAEQRAATWLAAAGESALPGRSALLIATATGGDDEMRARIERHQLDRAFRVPGLATLEEPLRLADALRRHSAPQRLIVVDCLTLWLTNWLMPLADWPDPAAAAAAWAAERAALLDTLPGLPGPVVLVGNEIGLGLSPLGREVRHFVDELGRLHQDIAARCADVTLMVAGLELPVRRGGSPCTG